MWNIQKVKKFYTNVGLILSLVFIMGTFSGCSSSGKKDNATKSVNTTSGQSTKDTSSTNQKKSNTTDTKSNSNSGQIAKVDTNKLPSFNGSPYVTVNGNVPSFTKDDLTTKSFEKYSDLDSLGRVGVANANIGKDIMPTEKRGEIGMIKPTGWQTVKYDNVDGKYLYNRCHLVGFQLAGENANEKNLMTGTRYLNVDGMLPFENQVADYVKETGHHVRYRVTPIFVGKEPVARGVQMEGQSVEDNGSAVKFNVYVFNNQPGIDIDYATGKSGLNGQPTTNGNNNGSASKSQTSTAPKATAAKQAVKTGDGKSKK